MPREDTTSFTPIKLVCKVVEHQKIPQKKIALVIGNTNYDSDDLDLKNPTNDADSIAAALKNLEFQIILKKDLDYDSFSDEILKFSLNKNEYDFSIVYYAGHAVQDQNGNSYILPSDFTNTNSFEKDAISVTKILNLFESSPPSPLQDAPLILFIPVAKTSCASADNAP